MATTDFMKLENPAVHSQVCSHLTAIVLAGGASRRMGGHNKALIKIDGESIIERELNILDRLFKNIILITNTFEDYSFLGKPMYSDIKPGYGSLGGLYTGLNHCSTEYGFVFACDMPFLNQGIVGYICGKHEGHDVTIPRINGFLEPLHAVYSRRCIPFIEKLLRIGDLKIVDLFPYVDVMEIGQDQLEAVDCDLKFQINVNTPNDLAAANKAARRGFHKL